MLQPALLPAELLLALLLALLRALLLALLLARRGEVSLALVAVGLVDGRTAASRVCVGSDALL